jgi:hypothetical protein
MSVELGRDRECSDSHTQPLTDTDLTELWQQRAYDEKEENASEAEGRVSNEILVKKNGADASKFGNC